MEPLAYLRDAHEGEGDVCLVPAAKGDPGAFPVYAAGVAELIDDLEQTLARLLQACDTGDRNQDGEQRGVRMPERTVVLESRAFIASYRRFKQRSAT